MKKFTPNIVIWNITILSKDDNFPLVNWYFLSHKRAEKFYEKMCDKYDKDYNVVFGGETLWLFDIKE